MMNYLTFGKINTKNFNAFVSGESTFVTAERDIEVIPIPGRNGTLSVDNGRFHNVSIVYPCFIVDSFRANYDALRAAFLSESGYNKLIDTYDPDHYRRARYTAAIDPEMTQLNRHGKFDLAFDCDPRRFLVSGDKVVTFSANGSIKNPTLYNALPFIRAYGTGYFEISGVRVTITSASTYTDIDCELQEAYKGSTNCNGNITLNNGEFPKLIPGINQVTISGISRIELTSRWWTI